MTDLPMIATMCGNVLLYGAIGWGVVYLIHSRRHARAAGLCLALGFALGNIGGHAGTQPELLLRARGLGSLIALAVLATIAIALRRSTRVDAVLEPGV
jgi:hypothetical protein